MRTGPPSKAYRKYLAPTLALATAAACAPRPMAMPSGPGAPFPEAGTAYEDAIRTCRGVRTLTAELGLSGKAGRTRIRGRVIAGFERPDAVRLEGVAPFGAPAFVFVARDGRATLLLPRDHRVLRDAPPAAVVEALTGINLAPDALAAALAGCGVPPDPIADGRRYGEDEAVIGLANGASLHLRRHSGRWRIVGAAAGTYAVEYPALTGDRPARVRVRTTGATATADLSVTLSQVDINTDLDPAAFEVDVPADAAPITLDELRSAGPLGQKT